MAENDSFTEKEEEIIDIERKDGLLEELELPPKVIKFIRENSQRLQIVAACVVILILGWTYYDYHVQNNENKGSAALNAALLEEDETSRIELLKNVTKDFSSTDAAFWSRIEQGHISFKAGDYEGALLIFNEILDDISASNPLRPLLHYNIGLACENNGDMDKALQHYGKLSAFNGFEVKALTSQGRIHQLNNNYPEALSLYRQALENKDVTSQDKLLLQEKIDTLQVIEGKSEEG